MPSRRAQIAMTDDETRAYLAEGHTLVLVTTGPDGLPDPLPMWYVVGDDGAILMRTYGVSQKTRNAEREPRAAALVETGERYDQLRGVQLTGRIEVDRDVESVLDVTAALAVKYHRVTPEDAAVRTADARAAAGKFVVLRFVPERVVTWDHSKLAAGVY